MWGWGSLPATLGGGARAARPPWCGGGAVRRSAAPPVVRGRPRLGLRTLAAALPEPNAERREAVRQLRRMFYQSSTDVPEGQPSAQQQQPQPSTEGEVAGEQAALLLPLASTAGATPGCIDPLSARIEDLPLWRAEFAVFPHSQSILHVHKPHYLHLFDELFTRPRPWVFGNLYLEGGSTNLGAEGYRLEPGSQAPMVGTLMTVTRAVRLVDGKLLILATASARFRVVSASRELPYSRATVELLPDAEETAWAERVALEAAVQASADDDPVTSVMAAGGAAAVDAAAALAWAWLEGYELAVARRQTAGWGGCAPREGPDDIGTLRLVQELAEYGVPEVLSLPDGVVCGRQELGPLAKAADAAAQEAATARASSVFEQLRAGSSSGSGGSGSSGGGSGLNTVSERGVVPESSQATPEDGELEGLFADALATVEAGSGASKPAARALASVLALEAVAWQELDTIATLLLRVKGQRSSLPYGLLQLRPSPSQTVPLAGSSTSSSDSDGTTSGVGYAYTASDGLDVFADPLWPSLRRASKLSYALAASLDLHPGEGRQAFLEHGSIAGRLRAAIARLIRQRKVLAAMAAVAGVSKPGGDGGPRGGSSGSSGGGSGSGGTPRGT